MYLHPHWSLKLNLVSSPSSIHHEPVVPLCRSTLLIKTTNQVWLLTWEIYFFFCFTKYFAEHRCSSLIQTSSWIAMLEKSNGHGIACPWRKSRMGFMPPHSSGQITWLNFMSHPYDHYHCRLHNIHHHAGFACLGYALKWGFMIS